MECEFGYMIWNQFSPGNGHVKYLKVNRPPFEMYMELDQSMFNNMLNLLSLTII